MGEMITEHYFEQSGSEILMRLAIDGNAVLDVLTDHARLAACSEMLRDASPRGLREVRMGSFGPFAVTMALHGDGSTVSIFVDGPDLEGRFRVHQDAGLYVAREEMLGVLDNVPAPAAWEPGDKVSS